MLLSFPWPTCQSFYLLLCRRKTPTICCKLNECIFCHVHMVATFIVKLFLYYVYCTCILNNQRLPRLFTTRIDESSPGWVFYSLCCILVTRIISILSCFRVLVQCLRNGCFFQVCSLLNFWDEVSPCYMEGKPAYE